MKIQDMIGGWFVGDFNPVAFKTSACEVSYKTYKAGDFDARHIHDIVTEITLIATGRVRMEEKEYSEGDIIIIKPGKATDFLALTDASTVVVKVPGVAGDKRLAHPDRYGDGT